MVKSFCLILCFGCSLQLMAQKNSNEKPWNEIEQQTTLLLKEARAKRAKDLIFPRTVVHDSLKLVNSDDWTSGFFPGILWMLYEHSHRHKWKTAAEEFTRLMSREPYNGNSHDVGFKVYCSYGKGYQLTNDAGYKRNIIQAAKTLASRFNSNTGCIKSWDFTRWQYPVIIDNMMNLELLFEATKLSGDSSFYKIAVTHANTTMKNHFRSDFSSYHVVDYDSITGKVLSKTTAQGYAPESAWARGQSWALYGFTMCYRETKDRHYLQQAEGIASFLLNHSSSSKDGIPYWDYNLPNVEEQPKDASAAAIMVAAFYELSKYSVKGKKYRMEADKVLKTLTNYYRAAMGTHHGFLLLHSTGHKPANSEVDVPIIYADYYYLEALIRSKQ